jgi:transcriptional regulator with XRE-family HTH domain
LASLGWTALDLTKAAKVPGPSVSNWRSGRMKPGLGPLVAICRATGWDLRSFLAGQIVQTSRPGAVPTGRARRERIHWPVVAARLRQMAELERPTSFRAAAAELGLDLHAIRKRLPTEVAALIGRRRALEHAEFVRRREARTSFVADLTLRILESGGRASRRDIEPLLPDGWQLREQAIGDAWRAAHAEWRARAA